MVHRANPLGRSLSPTEFQSPKNQMECSKRNHTDNGPKTEIVKECIKQINWCANSKCVTTRCAEEFTTCGYIVLQWHFYFIFLYFHPTVPCSIGTWKYALPIELRIQNDQKSPNNEIDYIHSTTEKQLLPILSSVQVGSCWISPKYSMHALHPKKRTNHHFNQIIDWTDFSLNYTVWFSPHNSPFTTWKTMTDALGLSECKAKIFKAFGNANELFITLTAG